MGRTPPPDDGIFWSTVGYVAARPPTACGRLRVYEEIAVS